MTSFCRSLCVFFIFASLCNLCDAQQPGSKGSASKPVPPLKIGVPKAPSSDYDNKDLRTFPGSALYGAARGAAADHDYPVAAQLQYWVVQKTGTGQYDLACYATMNDDIDAGFYWLQEAALKDGVDVAWANRDTDLVKLRADPRWKIITPFLTACNAYWAESGIVKTALVLPAGYQKGTPIGVVVGLHGMGANPSNFVDADTFQGYADELKMAIVAVSGTRPTGPNKFVWSEDAEKDHLQIQKALKSLENRFTIKRGHIVLFGFSQGAQMGFEAAWLHPEIYRGAIVMSPGTPTHPRAVGRTAAPGNKNQGYVCVCGADEHPGNVLLAKQADERARKGGAASELKLYEGVSQHTFPPDFSEKFVDWVRRIDGAGGGR